MRYLSVLIRIIIIILVYPYTYYGIEHEQCTSYTISNEHNERSTAYMYAHGLGATYIQANMYAKQFSSHTYPKHNYWILSTPLILFNFPDAKNDNIEYHSNKVNLGQHLDMGCLRATYIKAQEEFPHHTFVLCGVSRGAVTILNAAGTYNFTNLGAIVVESPFDHLRNVVIHLMNHFYIGWFPFAQNVGMKLCQKQFPLIDPHGVFPIKVINTIPLDLPILLIHSQRDWVIPVNSSRRLYMELIKTGHKHVYYLELVSGQHARLLCGPDGELYQNIVHAFYKKYGLAHDPVCAKNGEHLLSYCQPTIEEVLQRIRERRSEEFIEEPDRLDIEEQDLKPLLDYLITCSSILIKESYKAPEP